MSSFRRHAGRMAVIALGLFLPVLLPKGAYAEEAPKAPITIVVTGNESPDALKKLIDNVAAQGRPVSITLESKSDTAKTVGPKETTEPVEGEFLDLFLRGVKESVDDLPAAPQFFSGLGRWWDLPPPSTGFPIYLLKLAVVLGISGAASWLVLRLLGRIGPRLPASELAPLASKLRPALARLVKDIAAAAAFIGVASLVAARFFDPVAAEGKVTALLIGVLPFALSHLVVGNLLLSPYEPRLRLFMIPRAARHFALLVAYVVAGTIILSIIAVGDAAASPKGESSGLYLILSTLLVVFKIWWFWDARRDIAQVILSGAPEGQSPGSLRRLMAATTPWFLILSTVVLWALGRVSETVPGGTKWATALGATQVLIILVPILAVGVSVLARQRLLTTDPERTPFQQAVRALMVKISGGCAWLAGLALLGWTWRYLLIQSQSQEGLAALRSIISIIVLAIAGWALTSFVNALFNAYAARGVPTADDEHATPAGGVQTRIGSILPILRGIAIGSAIGLTILLVLTQLGFDIAPLLAGFTILGLAISFGSQTLVKDIVSGFFFMVEDAFRVGEYIDTGKLKGTVEKISLRSLQLRHQSGLIHTIPFGTLSQVTNASRDWATVKFSLRLDRSTDIEKARKTIKKVGLELMDDPEFAKGFLTPLKMQGVDEIADSAIVVRAKFTAQPAMASAIQREALKRVYTAFTKSGIEFASNAVTVRGGGSADAVAASAASSPPAPVPAN
ncbi:MAG: mechanosensitive ion channel family protein [Hyphomicrobiales bacterium]